MDAEAMYAIDRAGNRRRLRPGEILRDGERIRVPIHAMDSAPRPMSRAEADQIAAQAIARQRGYGVQP